MGGTALSYISVRLTKKVYDRLAHECVERLRALYPQTRINALTAYRAKYDFGDCDILIEDSGYFEPHQAAKALDAVELVQNGPVASVGIKVRPEIQELDGNVFQVDLIRVAPESYDFALNYFGRGDAANLIGRLFHACGLVLRHDGLYYYVRDGDYKFAELLLTRNFEEALRFLEYDPRGYAEGFDTPEDIYRYVASSPYFNPEIFLLHNRNAKSRVRDKKRKMYMQFLKFCEKNPQLTKFDYPEEKSFWLPRIEKHFPNFKADYESAQEALRKKRTLKEKFNGKRVSEITGLTGKELGVLMKRFREAFASDAEMHSFILESRPEDVENRVKQLKAALYNP